MDAGIGTYLVMIARLPYQSSRTGFSCWWWHQDPDPVLMYIAGVDPFPIWVAQTVFILFSTFLESRPVSDASD
jgi:hypothetical protein